MKIHKNVTFNKEYVNIFYENTLSRDKHILQVISTNRIIFILRIYFPTPFSTIWIFVAKTISN